MKSLVRLTIVCGMLLAIGAAMHAAPAPEPESFREKAILKGHWIISNLAFSPDGKRLAVADQSREGIRLWDVATGKVALVLPHRQAGRVQFSPDGKIVATASRNIKLWDAGSGKELATFKDVSARCLLFSADSKLLAAVAKDYVTVLSVAKKEEMLCYDLTKPRHLIYGYPSCKKPALALGGGRGKPIALIDLFTGREFVACQKRLEEAEHFAVDREGKILAGFCWELGFRGRCRYEIVLWSLDRGKKIASWEPAVEGMLQSLVVSPEGNILVLYDFVLAPALGGVPVSGLRFYELPSGRLLGFQEMPGLNCHTGAYDGIHGLVFSPNGRLLATAEGSMVRLWSIPKDWRKKK